MAGKFGGAIKLTGESEYRKALTQITNNLKSLSSEMKVTASAYDRNDKSIATLEAKQKALNKTLESQSTVLVNATKSYNSFQKEVEKQAKAHNDLEKEYKEAQAELEKIKKTSGEASKEYQDQAKKVEDLKKAYDSSSKAQEQNETGLTKLKVAMDNAQVSVNKTSNELNTLEKELNESKKASESAEKGTDDLKDSLDDVDNASRNAGDGFTVMKGAMANLVAQGITAAINGMKKLASSMVDIGKQAYANYSAYEQLTGGVETLFGNSANTVMNYANNAYKTSGLSANAYMETVTSFSASLLQGLGGDTEKAAKYADTAITDMSDNANKMGTSMQMIQNAYQGFAKNNYTMLDNLKLGYGGTKSEMARLVKDSGILGKAGDELTAKNLDQKVSYDQIIQAIHIVQERMGIAGTTSKEAADTMEGSTASMSAAWQNLLTGIADEKQDISPLIDNLVDSIKTAAKNSIPRIKEIFKGMGELISTVWNEVIPEIGEEIPELQPFIDVMNFIKNNSDTIISALAGIGAGFAAFKVGSVISSLTGLLAPLWASIQSGTGIMAGLNGVMAANPVGAIALAIGALVGVFTLLWTKCEWFRDFWIGLWELLKSAVGTAVEGIGSFIDNIISFFSNLPSNIQKFIDNVKTSISNWATDIVSKGKEMGSKFVSSIVNFFKELPTKISNFITSAYKSVTNWVSNMVKKASEVGSKFISNVVKFISQLPSKIATYLSNVISRLGTWVSNMGNKGKQAAKSLFDSVVNGLKSLPSSMANIGKNIVQGLWNGISGLKDWVIGKVKDLGSSILGGIKKVLGIHSPSRVFRDQVGKNIVLGIAEGIGKNEASVLNGMNKLSKNMVNTMKKVSNGNYKEVGASAIKTFESSYKTMITNSEKSIQKQINSLVTKRNNELDKQQEKQIAALKKKITKKNKTQINAQISAIKENTKKQKAAYTSAGKEVMEAYEKAMNTAAEKVKNTLTSKLEDIYETAQAKYDEVKKLQDSMNEKLSSYGDLFTRDDEGNLLVNDLNNNINALKVYNQNLTDLKGKISDSLMEEITSMSVDDAIDYSKALLSMSTKELQAYDKQFKQQQNLANSISKNFYASKLKEIKDEYISKVNKAFKDSQKQLKKAGEEAINGFIEGMTKSAKSNDKTVQKIAKDIVKTMKKALKINSPSKVFEELGMYSGEGYNIGFVDSLKNAKQSITEALPTDIDLNKIDSSLFNGMNTTTSENVSNVNMVEAFKEALAQMKIELDDEKVGKFVDKTVANAIYR